ncbi:MAG TPA: flagellar hook capping FlgD N-terminal domain-containing protein [Nocardioidaceae bacterium]|nr:flagellar hook capping FlgD N-terminal domain-containing protein [Nocardioidaceae bacterium]
MSVSATEGVTGGLGVVPQGTTQDAFGDKQLFLQLLAAQLRYQDPMNPADSSEFLSQTAQFTSLEKMQDVADQTAMVLSTQLAFGASGLVGRNVSYTDAAGNEASGVVKGVTFGATGPVLDVDGTEVPLMQVLSVTDGSASTPTP